MYHKVKAVKDSVDKNFWPLIVLATGRVLEENYSVSIAADVYRITHLKEKVAELVEIYQSDEYAEYEASVAG